MENDSMHEISAVEKGDFAERLSFFITQMRSVVKNGN